MDIKVLIEQELKSNSTQLPLAIVSKSAIRFNETALELIGINDGDAVISGPITYNEEKLFVVGKDAEPDAKKQTKLKKNSINLSEAKAAYIKPGTYAVVPFEGAFKLVVTELKTKKAE
jgi:hypothetical protein